MSDVAWQVYLRRPDQTLLEHLCAIRRLDPNRLTLNFEHDLHDPHLLPDMATARKLIVAAVENKWPVAIFGDYDADGTPASALLWSTFKQLGLSAEVFLPTRETGYGLSEGFVEPIAKNAKLLITVDTGITALESIRRLNKLGVQTIILDHHLPSPDGLPPAAAIVDPYLDTSRYPFSDICGCTLAFKLAQALARDFPLELSEAFLKWQLDLVAISTVSDMMTLRDENRTLVHFGLEVIKKTRRPGLQALIRESGLIPDKITAGSLGYTIGPRFNAAGRLGDNRPVFDLLTTSDKTKAEELATQINGLNRRRQELVEATQAQAEKLLLTQNSLNDFALLVVEDNWPPGVVGLVAGRLAEKYHRPVVVGSRLGDIVRASGRSVDDYPLIDGLTASKSFLDRFGGHRQAAGLSVLANNWENFSRSLKNHAQQHFKNVLPRRFLKADAYLDLSAGTLAQVEELRHLEPHGLGNHRPTFIIRDVGWRDLGSMGGSGQHARLRLIDDHHQLSAVGFSLFDRLSKHKHRRFSVAGYLGENNWQDRRSVQFQIIDFKALEADIQEKELT